MPASVEFHLCQLSGHLSMLFCNNHLLCPVHPLRVTHWGDPAEHLYQLLHMFVAYKLDDAMFAGTTCMPSVHECTLGNPTCLGPVCAVCLSKSAQHTQCVPLCRR